MSEILKKIRSISRNARSKSSIGNGPMPPQSQPGSTRGSMMSVISAVTSSPQVVDAQAVEQMEQNYKMRLREKDHEIDALKGQVEMFKREMTK